MHLFMSIADKANQNLAISQKELLLWHQRLGHADQQQIQPVDSDLQQVIQPKQNARQRSCVTCQLRKQPSTGAGMSRSIPIPSKKGSLTAYQLNPGQTVSSIHQYILSSHGPLGHAKGKESKLKKFTGGTLFAGHATLYIHCTNQGFPLCW
jgi:hypothetical protein